MLQRFDLSSVWELEIEKGLLFSLIVSSSGVGKMKIQVRKGVFCFVALVLLSAVVVISRVEEAEEPLLAYLVDSGLINLEMVYI